MSQIKINFQLVKSSKITSSIIANISFGYRLVETKSKWSIVNGRKTKVTHPIVSYKPVRISTGITIPPFFWNKSTKKATTPYKDVNKKLEDFKGYVSTLYDALSDNGKKEIEPERLFELVKLHISSKYKEGELKYKHAPSDKKTKFINIPRIVIPKYFGKDVNGIPTQLKDYIDYKIEKYQKEGAFNSDITGPTLKIYKRFKAIIIQYEEDTHNIVDLMTVTVDDVKAIVSFFIHKKREDGKDYSYNYMSWIG